MRVLVDGVVFGAGPSAAADRWERLLRTLAPDPDVCVDVLDRGGAPTIDGATTIGFPSYQARNTPADSLLLQRVATHHGADVFVSTGWTTPTTTPSVAVLFAAALPPHVALGDRESAECALAIRHASRVVCVGDEARTVLRDQFGGTDARVAVEVDPDRGDAALGRTVAAALHAAATTAAEAAGFYSRWAALREIQARVDG